MATEEDRCASTIIMLILFVIVYIVMAYIASTSRALNKRYEAGINSGEVFQIDDTRYKCDKVEVQETIWKKVK